MSIQVWRSLSAYPLAISKTTAELLDTIEEILPLRPDPAARPTDAVSAWLYEAGAKEIASWMEVHTACEELVPTLHERPEPRFLDLFLDGDYGALYEKGEEARVHEAAAKAKESKDRVRLSARGGRRLVVIEPTSNRAGRIVRSNFLPKGTVVRSSVPWTHAMRPRSSWGNGDTIVDPQQLEVSYAHPSADRSRSVIAFKIDTANGTVRRAA